MHPTCLMCDALIEVGPLCENCIRELQETREARAVRKTKCTFNINADLHKLLKVEAAVHDRDMVELVEEALAWFLHGNLEGLQLRAPLYERPGTSNEQPPVPPANAGGKE